MIVENVVIQDETCMVVSIGKPVFEDPSVIDSIKIPDALLLLVGTPSMKCSESK